jgi:hypothetical protein
MSHPPRTKSVHAPVAVRQLVEQGVPEDQAVLAAYGHPHPLPSTSKVTLDFDSDEPLPVCPLRNNGDDICESCQ